MCLWRVYNLPLFIQTLIFLPHCLISIQTLHCDIYSKYLLSQVHVNMPPFVLCIATKANQPMLSNTETRMGHFGLVGRGEKRGSVGWIGGEDWEPSREINWM